MSRRSNAESARRSAAPGSAAHEAIADPGNLRPEDLTEVEQKLGSGRSTPAEFDAALASLFARARATPGGCIAVVPEGLEGDDDDDP